MGTGAQAEIIRTGVHIRVWLQGLNRNNKARSSDPSKATGTQTEIIRAGVQIRVWLQGLENK
jgi:hypothetical protein